LVEVLGGNPEKPLEIPAISRSAWNNDSKQYRDNYLIDAEMELDLLDAPAIRWK
jgi:hypothetical protein